MRAVLFLISALFYAQADAQLSMGVQKNRAKKPDPIPANYLETFKGTTTYFFVRVGEEAWIEDLQHELSKVWTVTPIEVHSITSLGEVLEGKSKGEVSTLMISSYRVLSDGGDQVHVYLTLATPYLNDKGEQKELRMASMDLHLSGNSTMELIHMADFSKKAGEYLYTKAEIRTWSKGLLLKQLQYLNSLIEKGKARWVYEETRNEREMKNLRRSTLYVMDHVGIDFNKHNAVEKPMSDPQALFKKYPYTYQLISGEELSNKLMEEEEPFYYLVYIKSSVDKFAVVYKSDTGEMIYSHYAPMSYKFKDKDMEKLAGALKKLK